MNKQWIALSALQEGAAATVKAVELEGMIARRLYELGVTEGTRVQCLQKSPTGDPVAYAIRGAVIALRCADTARILVEAR